MSPFAKGVLTGIAGTIGVMVLLVALVPNGGPTKEATAAVDAAARQPLVASAPAVTQSAASPISTDAAYARASALKICANEWPNDLALRGGCVRNAKDGLQSFREIASRYKDVPDMQRALAGCLDEWTKDGATDFSMAGGCARNNEDGLRSLK